MPASKAYLAHYDAVVRDVCAILHDRGYPVTLGSPRSELFRACSSAYRPKLHEESRLEYLTKIVRDDCVPRHQRVDANAGRQREFSEYVPEPHPRAAEMDVLPHHISMPWDGTGVSW